MTLLQLGENILNNINAAESATRNWLRDVVIGEGFCPFASAVPAEAIQFEVSKARDLDAALTVFGEACRTLKKTPELETILIIFENGFRLFDSYLDLLELADALAISLGYEGVFQVASFHPRYVFDGCDENDAANYTNRSPFPMLHLLREASVTNALSMVENADAIPERNIAHARSLGVEYFKNKIS